MGAILLTGCVKTAGKLVEEIKPHTNVSAASRADFGDYGVKRIAVLPFKNESEDKKAGFKVAGYFYNNLSARKEYEVSPPLPGEGKGMRIEFLRPRLGADIVKPASRLVTGGREEAAGGEKNGPEAEFDAIVTGRILRYRDRASPLLSMEPASVYYEVYLISMKDGSVLWQATYDETQQPLDENLLLLDRYAQGGFWWWTSDRMTRMGMERVLKTFPGIKVRNQKEDSETELYIEPE
jgi:hypothetical protein